MNELTPEESTAFVQAASVFLGQRERLEFFRDQAVVAGAKSGPVTLKQSEADAIVALSDKLFRLLCRLKQRHPMTTALRFRKHLFLLIHRGDQAVGMEVIPEAGIVSVEG